MGILRATQPYAMGWRRFSTGAFDFFPDALMASRSLDAGRGYLLKEATFLKVKLAYSRV
jgi:hypothetical protein